MTENTHIPALKIGDTAPDFTLPTDGDGTVTLSDLLAGSLPNSLLDSQGQTVVLYFYPRDNTPGCTTQACDFRDNLPDFSAVGATVVGISQDSPKKHDGFKAKHNLNFTLATDDENATVCKQYGVWQPKKFMGREFLGIVRTTFAINSRGIITHIWHKVKVKGHVESVLEFLK